MVTVGEELDKAVQGAFTRPVAKSAGAQLRYLVRQHQRSTRRVAELLGISQRTVERYVKNQIKPPGCSSPTGWNGKSARAGSRRSGPRPGRPPLPPAAS